jgi:hypothetical protein
VVTVVDKVLVVVQPLLLVLEIMLVVHQEPTTTLAQVAVVLVAQDLHLPVVFVVLVALELLQASAEH